MSKRPIKSVLRLFTQVLAVLGLGLFAYESVASAAEKPSISLSEAISRALNKNAKLQSYRSEAEASRASVSADEPILPAPVVTWGSMGTSGPFKHRETTSWIVSQTIPFPSKSFSKRNALSHESEARKAMADSQALQLKSDVIRVFFEYLESFKRLQLISELKEIYHHHLKRLRAGAAQDQLMKSHILSLESETDALENELQGALALQEEIRGELNLLMGEDPSTPLEAPEEPTLSNIPETLSDEAIKSALLRHPDHREIDSRFKAAKSMQSSARSSWLPDFMVSYRYNKRHDVMPDESELMVGVSVPFLTFWQPKAENERATARLEAARTAELQQDREWHLRYIKIRAKLTSYHSQLENLQKNIVPAAYQRVQIMTRLSPTDMSSLVEHREALEKYVKFKMEFITKRTEYESALASLQSLTGEMEQK